MRGRKVLDHRGSVRVVPPPDLTHSGSNKTKEGLLNDLRASIHGVPKIGRASC